MANDTPPSWLQTALTRALVAVAEGRSPEPLTPPPPASFRGDPSGPYSVPGVGDVAVRRENGRLRLEVGQVAYDAFEVEPGVHYVPGVDVMLRFNEIGAGVAALAWDSIGVVAPEVPRASPR